MLYFEEKLKKAENFKKKRKKRLTKKEKALVLQFLDGNE
jgi:hypothetical protein